jgi:hypothetical protein
LSLRLESYDLVLRVLNGPVPGSFVSDIGIRASPATFFSEGVLQTE